MQELPPIGTTELQGRSVEVARVLAAGFAAPWVNLVTGERRAWLAPRPPAGAEVTSVSCRWFNAHLGQVAREVRQGAVFEVTTVRDGQPRFYVSAAAPPELVLSALVRYRTTAHRGRVSRLLTWEFPDAVAERARVVAEV